MGPSELLIRVDVSQQIEKLAKQRMSYQFQESSQELDSYMIRQAVIAKVNLHDEQTEGDNQEFEDLTIGLETKMRSYIDLAIQVVTISIMQNMQFINQQAEMQRWAYSLNAIWLATQISQEGQVLIRSTTECIKLIYEFLVSEPPKQWFSVSTLVTWHKDISQIQVNRLLSYVQKVESFGVIVNKSTRRETKQFVMCLMFWDSGNFFLNN
ncbi:12520_t:CDS:2 [Cetraspora pellucida]|uniref:12520_t:CDS:1 n=1 Tax=Cetraspora pellucida TaxID=1433469 RepID=A0ACA9KBV0_9GLOM|nr:12520_t:CDS:2 [Cetraspora pellucida]